MKLSVGSILVCWERRKALRFYEALCEAPVDIVYLGENGRGRRLLKTQDWLRVAERLRSAGKDVVVSTRAQIDVDTEFPARALQESADTLIEANDYGCVESLAGRSFVAGPHLNVADEATLALLALRGARRWVAPVGLPLGIVAALAELRPPDLQIEMLAPQGLPRAFPARASVAHAHRHGRYEHSTQTTESSRPAPPFLVLNALPTRTIAPQKWLSHLRKLCNAGVDVLRLSPHSQDFSAEVHAIRAALRDSSGAGLPALLSWRYRDVCLDAAGGTTHQGIARVV